MYRNCRESAGIAQLAKLASIGGRGAASIVDQASAAAIGFVCSVFVGRFLGAESLGIYAIASVFVLFIVAVQAAIILDPMSVFGAKKPGEEMPRYYGFLVGLEVSVVSLFIVFLALGSLLAYVLGFVERTLFLVLGAAAIYANFLCFHYFLRRQFYLEHRQHLATVQSIAYLALVAAGFSALWWLGGSTVPRVYIVLSLCSFAICIFQSKLLANKVRRPEAGDVKRYAGEHWSFGKWVLLGVPLGFMNYSGYFFIVGSLLSTEAAGNLKAVDVLIAPFSQVAIGLSLMLLPMTARNIDRMSLPAQRGLALRMGAPLMALAVMYAALMFFAGEYALGLLFPRKMADALPLVGFMALLPIFQALPMPAGIILSALQRPYLRLISYGIAVFGAICVSIPLMLIHGLVGAAVGMLTSQVLFAVSHWACLFWVWRRMAPQPTPRSGIGHGLSPAAHPSWPLGSNPTINRAIRSVRPR